MDAQKEYERRALDEVRERRRRNLAAYRQSRQTAEKDDPRLGELQREMTALGAMLGTAALSGDRAKLDDLRDRLTALSAERDALLAKLKLAEPPVDCPLCRDTGYVGGAICDCVRKLARNRIFADLSKETPIDRCSFDTFDLSYYPDETDPSGHNPRRRMTQIFNLCRDYADRFGPDAGNLLFLGKTGLGKTHLSLSIAAQVLAHGYGVVYGPVQNLLTPVGRAYFGNSEDDGPMEALYACDLLILDDLGTELGNSFTNMVIYNVINTRLLQKKPTIISTNLTMQELEQRYEPRVSSRLIGNYTIKQFLGADVRQLKRLPRREG